MVRFYFYFSKRKSPDMEFIFNDVEVLQSDNFGWMALKKIIEYFPCTSMFIFNDVEGL